MITSGRQIEDRQMIIIKARESFVSPPFSRAIDRENMRPYVIIAPQLSDFLSNYSFPIIVLR